MIIQWLAFVAIIAFVLGIATIIIEKLFPINGAESQRDDKHENMN